MKIKDEYKKGDPYNFKKTNYFHKKRIELTKKIIYKLSKNSKILDVGCGKGHITEKLVFNNNMVLGIDYSHTAIKFARKKQKKNLKFKVIDVEKLARLKQKYDIIVANNLFEHIENQNKFLKNCRALLDKNGYLVISTPQLYSFVNLLKLIFTKKIDYRHENHICEFSKIQMTKFCENNDLKIIQKKYLYDLYSQKNFKSLINNTISKMLMFFKMNCLAPTVFYIIRKK